METTIKENRPIQGVIFMHPEGPCLREIKDKQLQDNILRLQGGESENGDTIAQFYFTELGMESVMFVTDVVNDADQGIKYTDLLKVNIRQFGEWNTWEEFFDLIQAACLIFSNPNFKLKEKESNDGNNQENSPSAGSDPADNGDSGTADGEQTT